MAECATVSLLQTIRAMLSQTSQKKRLVKFPVFSSSSNLAKSNYYNLRDAAWRVLLDSETGIPIEPEKIIKSHNWLVATFDSPYGQTFLEAIADKTLPSIDAITFTYAGYVYILYNNDLPTSRIRFSLAHEIGHIILQHQARGIDNYEREANMFAARLLMPMCIIKKLNIQSPNDLAKTFKVSLESATYRFARYQKLLKRNKFFISNLENQLIEKYKNILDNKEDKNNE